MKSSAKGQPEIVTSSFKSIPSCRMICKKYMEAEFEYVKKRCFILIGHSRLSKYYVEFSTFFSQKNGL